MSFFSSVIFHFLQNPHAEMELSRRDKRVLIWYCWKRHLTSQQAQQELAQVLGTDCPSLSSIKEWIAHFHQGRLTFEDDPRSGRLPSAVTEENITAIRDLIDADPHITTRQLLSFVDIGSGSLQSILHDHLKIRKLCARWVPHRLTQEQKMRRVDFCHFMLERYETADRRRLAEVYTEDETWLYYYDIPLKRQSAMWVFEDEDPPTVVRRSRSVGKRMFAFFLSTSGIATKVMLESKKTVTAKWFTEVCLSHFLEVIQEQRPNTGTRGIHLHMDNAPAHTALATQHFLDERGVKILPHSPYSPDLAPCDFWLFPVLKAQLRGRQFQSDEDLEQAAATAIEQIPKDDFSSFFNKWIERMHKCISVHGEYFEHI